MAIQQQNGNAARKLRAMKKDDLKLRVRAKQGDMDAGVALGKKYLLGLDGFPVDVATGVGYMAASLNRSDVRQYLAEELPLELLVELELVHVLRLAAESGSELACSKYGLVLYLSGESTEAEYWLKKGSGATSPDHDESTASTLDQLAGALMMKRNFNRNRTIELLLRRCPDHLVARLCKIALQYPRPPLVVHSRVYELVKAAANRLELGPLDPDDVSTCLAFMSTVGSNCAQYFLGRSQLGLSCGSLPAEALVPKPNYREGYARLLRAAHAGSARAWYDLFVACSDYRSVLANQGAAQFFLEQAAASGVTPAKTCLAARTLLDAETAEDLARGQQWLCQAAEAGEELAMKLLSAFFPTSGCPDLAATDQIAQKIAGLDPRLAIILRLASAFCLTRKEALSLDLKVAVLETSLIFHPQSNVNATFALPARTAIERNLLREAVTLAADGAEVNSGEGFARRRSSAQRDLFKALNLQESMFFLPETAALGQYRSIGKWKNSNRVILKEAAQPHGDVKAR